MHQTGAQGLYGDCRSGAKSERRARGKGGMYMSGLTKSDASMLSSNVLACRWMQSSNRDRLHVADAYEPLHLSHASTKLSSYATASITSEQYARHAVHLDLRDVSPGGRYSARLRVIKPVKMMLISPFFAVWLQHQCAEQSIFSNELCWHSVSFVAS